MPDLLKLDVSEEVNGWGDALGERSEAWAERVIAAACATHPSSGDLALLLTHDSAMQALNAKWRGKDKATNVLSFPAASGFGALGDIALGFDTVAREARQGGKSFNHHATHLLVHGYLHLLGFDHVGDADAAAMENAERSILATLNIADPYALTEAR